MITTIEKTFHFEAAHCLPKHRGKCKELHGHSYKVTIRATGSIKRGTNDPDNGMVIDFDVLSNAFRTEVFDLLDHKYLNHVLPPVIIEETTAELIAEFILRRLTHGGALPIDSVTVWETETSCATVSLTEIEKFNIGVRPSE